MSAEKTDEKDSAQDTDEKDSAQDTDEKDSKTVTDEDGVERYESGQLVEKPEVTDEHKEEAEKTYSSYEEERPTVVLPGSDGTVAGTAVNEWIDDDGNPKFGNDEDSDADKDKDSDADKNEQPDAD